MQEDIKIKILRLIQPSWLGSVTVDGNLYKGRAIRSINRMDG